MRKFKNRLAMKVKSRMDYMELAQSLEKIGYKCQETPSGGYPWVAITDETEIGRIDTFAYLNTFSVSLASFQFIEGFKPELFLALAAMSEGEEFYPGEWFFEKWDHSPFYGTPFKIDSIGSDGWVIYARPDDEKSTCEPLDIRKATLEEIVAHFTKQQPSQPNEPPTDVVNHPSHYTSGKIEVIDFIEDQKLGMHLGNAVKYISRAGKKNPEKTVEDIEKAIWYLKRFIDIQT